MITKIKKYEEKKEKRVKAISDKGSTYFDSIYDDKSLKVIKDLLIYDKNKLAKTQRKFNKELNRFYYISEVIIIAIGATVIAANPASWAAALSSTALSVALSSIGIHAYRKVSNKKFDEKKISTLRLIKEVEEDLKTAPIRTEVKEKEIEQDLSDNVLLSVKEEHWNNPNNDLPKVRTRRHKK